MFVPVKSKEGKQLMPTSPPVARHLIKTRKATPYWDNGVYCIRLNYKSKAWFYSKIREKWQLLTLQGYETKELRDRLGLKKSSHKMSEAFDAHCVDSWVLAYHTIGGDAIVDNTSVFCISPLPVERRSLHRQLPQKDGKRPRYGGTRCLGLTKGTLVKHVKHGFAAVCGSMNNYLCLQPVEGGKRLTRSAKISDCKVLKKLNFRYKSVSEAVSIQQKDIALQLTLF